MRTVIEDGWVVAWNGKSHEVHEQGSVVFEGDRVVHAGPAWDGRGGYGASRRGASWSRPASSIPTCTPRAAGATTCCSTWPRTTTAPRTTWAFAAPLKGKMTPPPAEPTAAIRAFTFLHALKNGTTTVIDVGGLRRVWEGYARLVDDLGGPGFWRPSRSATATPIRTRKGASTTTRTRRPAGTPAGGGGLRAEVRRRGRGPAARPASTRPRSRRAASRCCGPARTRRARRTPRSTPTRAATSSSSSASWTEYRKTPIRFLADIGFLDDRTLLGHAVFTTAQRLDALPVRRRPDRAGRGAGSTVGHCPYKYAKMAMTLHSFQRYLDAGVTLGARHRYLSASNGVGSPVGVHPGQGHRCQLPGRARPRRLQRGHRWAAAASWGARDLGRLAPGRQGRHPADQPGPRRRLALRGPDQGAGRLGLRP